MNQRNNKLDKLFGPSFSYTGYVFIISGIITLRFSYSAIILIVLGAFISLTYTGTVVDPDNRRIKPYTAFFGLFKAGKWIDVNQSSVFRIVKSNRRYTTYSRANMRNDLYIRDLRLVITNKETKTRITVNKYPGYQVAKEELEELKRQFLIEENQETVING